MERKLKTLFDYQFFENNARLARLIGETESRCARKLSDEELGLVNAAGELKEERPPLEDLPATGKENRIEQK